MHHSPASLILHPLSLLVQYITVMNKLSALQVRRQDRGAKTLLEKLSPPLEDVIVCVSSDCTSCITVVFAQATDVKFGTSQKTLLPLGVPSWLRA